MSRKDELIEQLRELAGTPSELAALVGLEASDRSFQRALKDLVDEGVLVAEGDTSKRRYRNAVAVDIDAELLAMLPCSAHDFSDAAKRLGVESREVTPLKTRLEIETWHNLEDDRWYCRHSPGYVPPRLIASGFGAAVELGIERGVARTETFAEMSARAGKAGRIIGSGSP